MMPWTTLTSCRLQELCDCEGIQFRLPGVCFIIISREEEQKFLNSGIYIVGTKKSCFMGFGLCGLETFSTESCFVSFLLVKKLIL